MQHRKLKKLTKLLVLAPLALAACHSSVEQAPPPPSVEVLEVMSRTVPVEREYVGQTMGSREVEVRARVTGIIERRLYEEGAVVEAGTPLFRIDPKPFEVKVAEAEAELAHARAQLTQAERERKRLETLGHSNAVSQREIDDARSAAALAAADAQRAEAALRDARIQLGYTTVTAPISGRTGIARKFEGALVTADADSLLTTMVQADPIDVHFSISENEWQQAERESRAGLLHVPAEDKLQVHIERADGTVLDRIGRINFSDARIDSATGTYSLRARFPNADGALKAGEFVRVHVSGVTRPHAVAIPQTAVVEGPQGKGVYVVSRGENGESDASVAEFRPLEVGEWLSTAHGKLWVVRSGLVAGEQIIIDNLIKVRPGGPVAVIDTEHQSVEQVALAAAH